MEKESEEERCGRASKGLVERLASPVEKFGSKIKREQAGTRSKFTSSDGVKSEADHTQEFGVKEALQRNSNERSWL
jgi:hypothetical protein